MAIAQGKGGGALPGGMSQGKGGAMTANSSLDAAKLASTTTPGRAQALPHAGAKTAAQKDGDLASLFMSNRPTQGVTLPGVAQPRQAPLVMPPKQFPRPAVPTKPVAPPLRPQAPTRGNPQLNGPGQLPADMEWVHDGSTEHGAPSTNFGAWYARPKQQPAQPTPPARQPPLSQAALLARRINERAMRRRNSGKG